MKDESPQPVREEATPLFVGGGTAKSKRHWAKVVVIAALVILIVGGAFAAWWVFLRVDPDYLNISKLNSQDNHIAKAQALAKQPLPQKPEELAAHYTMIAAYLQSSKQYSYAEHYYLTAQKIADQHKLDLKDYRVYPALEEVYEATGNKVKADEYKKKEDDFIKANYSKEDVEQMEKAKPNGRPR